MQVQFFQVKNVLEQYSAGNKTFLQKQSWKSIRLLKVLNFAICSIDFWLHDLILMMYTGLNLAPSPLK